MKSAAVSGSYLSNMQFSLRLTLLLTARWHFFFDPLKILTFIQKLYEDAIRWWNPPFAIILSVPSHPCCAETWDSGCVCPLQCHKGCWYLTDASCRWEKLNNWLDNLPPLQHRGRQTFQLMGHIGFWNVTEGQINMHQEFVENISCSFNVNWKSAQEML